MKQVYALMILIFSLPIYSQEISEIDKLIASERFDDAYSLLIDLQTKQPKNPYLYFTIGETLLKSYINDPYSDSKSNVIKKAEKYFRSGAKTDSLNPLNYVGLGIIELFRNGDTVKADNYFIRANNLIPRKTKKLFGSGKNEVTDLQIKSLLKLETSELYSKSPRYWKAEGYNKILMEQRPLLPETYIAYGDIQLSRIKASEAIMLYKKALYLENSALTNFLIARIYYLGHNNEEAIRCYEMALSLDSTFAPAYNGLGDVYYKLKKNKLANYNYARFLALTGNNISSKIHYVNTLYKAKDFEAAINIAEDILKADSSRIYLYRLVAYSYLDLPHPDMGQALTYFQKLFSKSNEDELIAKDYSNFSKSLLSMKRDSNDIRMGIQMLEKSYLTDSTDKNVLVELIKESNRFKFYNVEIKYLTKMIKAGNENSNGYLALGKAYYYNKDYQNADSVFSLVTASDSLNLEAWKWRSNALMSIDPDLKVGSAKPAFEKILQIANTSGNKYLKDKYEALAYLGSYYMFTSNVDLTKAIEYIKESIDLKIGDPEKEIKAYYALGFAYYKSKQWINAKMAYETVLKLKPDDIYAPKALKDISKYLSANN